MSVEQLVDSMHKGVVTFTFIKVDGSVREAVGTLMPDAIESFLGTKPTPVSRVPNPDVVVYFDVGAQAFRSFRKSNFLEILEDD